jgi:hypothetical protein
MMRQFKKFKMKRLTGPEVRAHCLPHVLNLASKVHIITRIDKILFTFFILGDSSAVHQEALRI